MDEHVLATACWLDEAVATMVTVPFHCTLVHGMSLSILDARLNEPQARPVRFTRCFGEASLNVRLVLHRRTGLAGQISIVAIDKHWKALVQDAKGAHGAEMLRWADFCRRRRDAPAASLRNSHRFA
jgi:hypothetical protein